MYNRVVLRVWQGGPHVWQGGPRVWQGGPRVWVGGPKMCAKVVLRCVGGWS